MSDYKSLRWDTFFILESNIKNYEGMDLNKTRPVLVISTNHNLMDRALVVEISTQKVNKNSIEWFTYFSKLHNVDKTNYILPDRIHTIPRWLLTDGNKLKTRTIPQDIKIKIENFVKDVFNNE